jgi:hypothetical protein
MENQVQLNETGSVFLNTNAFEHAQRAAKALCSSDLVPKEYKGNISNTLIALDIANRVGASPLMVMQHLYIVHGKPSWSSTFLIAAINNCGRFNPLKYELSGDGDQRGCIAWTTEKNSPERLESPRITMNMAKKEGWVQKSGSKWQTMPELMMRYRAAAFFSRLFAPEITMGMQSYEEIVDVTGIEVKDEKKFDTTKSELDIAREKIITAIDKITDLTKQAELKDICVEATKNNAFDLNFAKTFAEKHSIEL